MLDESSAPADRSHPDLCAQAQQNSKARLDEKAFDDYWDEDFDLTTKDILAIRDAIDSAERAIDYMIYAFYGLTPEEIKIVEESV